MSRTTREKERKQRVAEYQQAQPITVERPIVAVLVPCYKQPHPRMQHSFQFMAQQAKIDGIDIFCPPIIQSSVVHWTRNTLLANLIQSKRVFTHALFIDDDIVPPQDALTKLIGHNKDIVAALCTKRQDPPIPNARLFEEKTGAYSELWQWPDPAEMPLLEMGAVGTGMMLVSLEAIQKIADAYFECRYEKELYGVSDEWITRMSKQRAEGFEKDLNAWWFRFLPKEDGVGEYGEDISFCHIARKFCGLQIYVDTSIQPGHMGDYEFGIKDFLDYRGPVLAKAKAEGRLVNSPDLPVELPEDCQKISILCPTRGRPESIARLMSSIRETADVLPELILYLDEDDESIANLSVPDGGWPKIITGPRITLSDMWNKLAEKATGDILFNCGDDVVFRTKGWDTQVKRCFAQAPDRIIFAHGDDGHYADKFGTHGFVHRKWIEAVGYFIPPYFSSDYGDAWLNEVANTLKRRVYLPIVTEHMHFLWGKAEKDQTHIERLERHAADKVDELYKTLAPERKRDVEKLRAAMAAKQEELVPVG